MKLNSTAGEDKIQIAATERAKNLATEFEIEYKSFFESKLSSIVLENKHLTPSVQKVSFNILELLNRNRLEAIKTINNDPRIEDELYGKNKFGRLDRQRNQGVIDQIEALLMNPKAPLECIMLIHALFIHRIYDHIPNKKVIASHTHSKNLRRDLVISLFFNKLFSDRGRIENKKSEHIELKAHIGITRSNFFTKKLPSTKIHLRGMDVFEPNLNSNYYQKTRNRKLPFASGISGHAGSLLLGARLYGALTKEGLKEYSLAIFAYLTAGGHHTYHESMLLTSKLGLQVESENYYSILPKRLLFSTEYQQLQSQFDNLIPAVKLTSSL